jgi:two-component system sensor histidine kinase DesK
MRLLPSNKRLGWAPYAWLIYLVFFFGQPIANHGSWREWLATILGVGIFLPLYFVGYWLDGRKQLWIIAALVLLGAFYAPFNPGASVFFVYAASFAAFAGSPAFAARILALIVVAIGLESFLLRLNPWFWGMAVVLTIVIGLVNIQVAQRTRADARLRLAQDEIEHLARVAERERIARDMHDVLGHTLSVVVLKSELASKLIDSDPARAKREIADVETISRQALAEVRKTIGGYRTDSLKEEVARAGRALQTAGVSSESRFAPVPLPPVQETVLALAVREAVTNVVRHAQARNCAMRFEQTAGGCSLEIQDDGRGGGQAEGNGLRGMRERVEALGGTLARQAANGTKLTITLPLPAKNNGIGQS